MSAELEESPPDTDLDGVFWKKRKKKKESKEVIPKMDPFYRPAYRWLGRSLTNYKALNTAEARERGLLAKLEAATTLTAARKVMKGQRT